LILAQIDKRPHHCCSQSGGTTWLIVAAVNVLPYSMGGNIDEVNVIHLSSIPFECVEPPAYNHKDRRQIWILYL
jgi:hypothetical protein